MLDSSDPVSDSVGFKISAITALRPHRPGVTRYVRIGDIALGTISVAAPGGIGVGRSGGKGMNRTHAVPAVRGVHLFLN